VYPKWKGGVPWNSKTNFIPISFSSVHCDGIGVADKCTSGIGGCTTRQTDGYITSPVIKRAILEKQNINI
jgi:hypothetical protein